MADSNWGFADNTGGVAAQFHLQESCSERHRNPGVGEKRSATGEK